MGDLISRRRLLETIGKLKVDYYVDMHGKHNPIEQANKIINCIEDAPTVTDTNVGNKWIPCSEELPKKSGKYLVTIREGLDVHTTVRRFNPKPKHPEQNKPVFTKHVPYYSGWERATRGVVAWCSLPEPYKGE